MKTIIEIRNTIENKKSRSAWDRGVIEYALELLEDIQDEPANCKELKKAMLNGADSWDQFSWGGSSLIYDMDIAKRLCNNTELKRTDYGHKEPNKNERWLDVQTRALYQACNLILRVAQ